MNANLGLSFLFNGIEKKQSLISTTIILQSLGRAESRGSPLCTGPITCICALMALRSCNNLHLPDFFFTTKIGVFQGD
ncbi:Uncharacterised protein [Chlamydia trachomatis]|nr:Uncharacterised protein [Chlamydia trachomatis]